MPLSIDLPEDFTAGASAHVAAHEATNAAVNATAAAVDALAFQPVDADLTTIAGLSPSNDDLLQRKSGAWINRTAAQVKTDLALTKTDVGLSNVTNNAQVTAVTAGNGTVIIAGTSTAPTVAVGTGVPQASVTNLVADLAAKLATSDAPELIRDTIGTALTAGDNVTVTPNDGSDTITVAATAGTITVQLDPASGVLRSTGNPALVTANGTTIPVRGLAFDPDADEAAFWRFRAARYSTGNLTVTVDWYADTANSGAVVWGAAIAAITPTADSQDVETDALATAATTTTTHAGTTGQRLHRTTITVSSLDSLAADDHVVLRVYRDADAGADTMTGDAILIAASVSYAGT